MTVQNILLFGLGVPEWLLILLAVILLFGGRKIPELMKGLGQGIREFNNAKSDVKKHIQDGVNEKETPQPKKGSESESASNEKTEK